MKLVNDDVGLRVRYHGPSKSFIAHDEHFRVKQVLPHGSVCNPVTFELWTDADNGRTDVKPHTMVGAWALCDDCCGRCFIVPQAVLSMVSEDCWCDACLTH